MKRIERVYHELVKLCQVIEREQIVQGFEGFSTEHIAEKCGFQRSNTSRELNRLVDNGAVRKSSGRPVLYFDMARLSSFGISIPDDTAVPDSPVSAEYDEDFSVMLKRLPNLEGAIRQGKAAMLYPPHGLNTILTGQSGVGKTFFAEAMYHFCVDEGLISGKGKFVVFNCAEYANNPQLLLSNLFGYVKGAFTGADREQKGVIDQADNGLLFLDEVHRLPASGQELLFLLIDKGYFRRLGGHEKKIVVNLRLVCATTENVEEFMLMTFRRRIPMRIHLPSLEEYSMKARYRLIELFFTKESSNIQIPIRVYGEALMILLYYNVPGNIGQLRGDIQLACARAFLEMQGEDRDCMYIKKCNLPDSVVKMYAASSNKIAEAQRFLQMSPEEYKVFWKSDPYTSTNENKSMELYHKIHQLYLDCKTYEYPQEKIIIGINDYIDSFFGKPFMYYDVRSEELDRLQLLVGQNVCETATEILKMAELRLNKEYKQKVFVALALHISVLLERLDTPNPSQISELEIIKSKQEHPDEFSVAQEMIAIASRRLGVLIPPEEAVYFSAFLYAIQVEREERIGLLLLMYGKSTASSMAEVANGIFSTNICHPIDFPLHMSEDIILKEVSDKMMELNNGQGILVLTDMGKLDSIAREAGENNNISVRCISMATTAVVIEAVRKCLYRGNKIDTLYSEVLKFMSLSQGLGSDNSASIPSLAGKVIMVTCISGLGAAVKLSNMIKSNIPEIKNSGIRMIPVSKDGHSTEDYNQQDVLMVVGGVDLYIPNIPFITLEEIIAGQGFSRISQLLGYQSQNESHEVSMTSVQQILSQYLSFIEPQKAIKATEESFQCLQGLLPGKNLSMIKFSYIIHCACLIERALWGQQLSHENTEALKQQAQEMFFLINQAMEVMNEMFCIKIADTEIAYIVEMIDTV